MSKLSNHGYIIRKKNYTIDTIKEVKDDLKFLKNNIFDPNDGIWSEVKENTAFRKETKKYKNAFGFGFFGLLGKHIYDIFKT